MNNNVKQRAVEIERLFPKDDGRAALKGELFSLIKMIVGVVLVVFLIQRFIFMSAEVHGNSMFPTLEDGERVIKWSLFYEPRNFDIIIMEHRTGENFVKRVIGVPGDHVEHRNGNLYLNGELVDEPHLLDTLPIHDFTLQDICQFHDCDVIPERYFLVLGDNRNNSEDSRSFGLIHESQIRGRVIWRFWPLPSFGSVN